MPSNTIQLSAVEIVLAPRPQTFQVDLRGTLYNCRLYWLVPAKVWVLNFADQFDNPIINGIPLVTGTNLLGQFQYLIPGLLFTLTDHTGDTDWMLADQPPNYTDLGLTGKIYYA